MGKEFTKTTLRIPPHNIDSEKALLGSIMLKPEVVYDVMDIIRAEAFYVEKHRIVFKAMMDLFGKHEPIDLLSLSSRLKEQKLLDSIGGNTFITELVNTVPSAANATHYAEIIRKKYVLRNLINAADHICELGYDEVENLDTVLDKAEKKIFSISDLGTAQKFVDIKDTVTEAWERLETLQSSPDALRGVPTGFRDLDQKLSGLQKSDLIILAARPSMGKTALALDIARQAALDHNIPVAIFSLEMSRHQLVDRMLSSTASVDSWKLRTGKLSTDQEFDDIRNSLDRLAKAPIFIDDQAGNNIMAMRAACRRLKSEKGLGMIIVDYLQLMDTSKSYDSMVNQVTDISRSLKALAKEMEAPVLALSQLSRAVEARGGTPRLSDLRDSGSIEQDADVVMFIHRDDKINKDSERPNVAEILIEKHRNGPTGKVELYFDEKKTTFRTLDNSHKDMAVDNF